VDAGLQVDGTNQGYTFHESFAAARVHHIRICLRDNFSKFETKTTGPAGNNGGSIG
jgi:hypothetical protein